MPRIADARLHCAGASYMTEAVGTGACAQLRHTASISDAWKPRLDDPLTPLVPHVLTTLTTPPNGFPLQTSLADDDHFSDSESEDDDDFLRFKPAVPTPALAQTLFDQDRETEFNPLAALNAQAAAAAAANEKNAKGGKDAKNAKPAAAAAAAAASAPSASAGAGANSVGVIGSQKVEETPAQAAERKLREAMLSARTQQVVAQANQMTTLNTPARRLVHPLIQV